MFHSGTAALIITYRRFANLEKLVDLCLQSGIVRVYISSDGSKSDDDREDVSKVGQEVARLFDLHPGKIVSKFSSINLGAAVNVLSSCDWVFGQESFAVVLEDDCIPSHDFFLYVCDYSDLLRTNSDLFMICGTQFAPKDITQNVASSSIYPMVWGWATSSDKWLILTKRMRSKNFSKFRFFKFESSDKTFWRAGARRAYEGYVDAWDIPLVKAIRDLNGKVLVPGSNLITNIGGDEHATHTFSGSKWLNGEIEKYDKNNSKVEYHKILDIWIRRSIYRISLYHQFSTRITYVLDKLGINKVKKAPLMTRWNLY